MTGSAEPSKIVALTFDDGPNNVYTPRLLDELAARNLEATFFLIGRLIKQHPTIVQRIRSEGHAIGNHTFSHPQPLVGLQPQQIRKEMFDCKKVIEDSTGYPAGPLFRPPLGQIDTTVLYAAGALGLIAVNWSADGEDWEKQPRHENIVRKIVSVIDSRKQDEIVLLHDGSPDLFPADRSQSLLAAKTLIEKYASNRRFVSIPEWMALRYSRG
jgi:peptidoglycan-N-acetylglucosamine deacetylase